MSHVFEPVAIKMDRCAAGERAWLKHRTHIMIIRMLGRLEEQKEELSKLLSPDHELVKKVDEMLSTGTGFRTWFYESYGLSKYFDLDVYISYRMKHFDLTKQGKDRSKVEDVFRYVLDSCLPKYLGIQINSIQIARPLYAPAHAKINIQIESGPMQTAATLDLEMDRPQHLEVPVFGEKPLLFSISGHRDEDAQCDFVNLLAANGLVTWIGFVGLRLEVRLWPEAGLEMQYKRAIEGN